MKLFLRYIYTGWALFWFFFLGFFGIPVFFIGSLFSRKTAAKIMLGYLSTWNVVWSFLNGMRYKVIGRDQVKRDQSYVYVSNHTANGDIFIIEKSLYNSYAPLAKKETGSIPIIGYLFKKACVFVDRSSVESRRNSVNKLKNQIKEGVSILIFPEGTRNLSNEIPFIYFHPGAFRIAIQLQVPVAPLVVINARSFMPDDKFPFQPVKLKSVFGKPIPTSNLTVEDTNGLKLKVHEEMLKLLQLHDPNYSGMSLEEMRSKCIFEKPEKFKKLHKTDKSK